MIVKKNTANPIHLLLYFLLTNLLFVTCKSAFQDDSDIHSSLEHNTVFSSGEDGYVIYPIPSVISTSNGNGITWSYEKDITHQGRDVKNWGIAVK